MKLRTVLQANLFLCIAFTQSALVQSQTAAPTFSPAAGVFNSEQSVTISDTTAGAIIYYTTNGTAPTTNSMQYTAGLRNVHRDSASHCCRGRINQRNCNGHLHHYPGC
jgi:hypothetical protein